MNQSIPRAIRLNRVTDIDVPRPMRQTMQFDDLATMPVEDGNATSSFNISSILRQHRFFIVLLTLVGTTMAALVAAQLKPMYRAESTVLIDPHPPAVNTVQSVLPTQYSYVDPNSARSQVAILLGLDLARQVVTKLSLYDLAEFQPGESSTFKSTSPFRNSLKFVGNAIDFARSAVVDAWSGLEEQLGISPGIDGKAQAPAFQKDPLNRAIDAAVDRYRERLSVIDDGRSYVITVRFAASDPNLAAKLVNAHVQAYLDSQVAAKTDTVKDADTSIKSQLDALAAKLLKSEETLQAYRDANRLTGLGATSVIAQQVSDLDATLTQTQAEAISKQAHYDELQAALKSPNSAASTEILASPAVERLRGQESVLKSKLAQLSSKFGDAYPEIKDLKAQIADVERAISAEINKVVQAAANEVRVARTREATLKSNLQTLGKRVTEQDVTYIKARELAREVESNKAVYAQFLQRYKEVSVQGSLQLPDSKVLGAALPPANPYFPRQSMVIAAGFGGSLGLALVIAMVLGLRLRGLNHLEDVERECGAPGLGIVPMVRKHPFLKFMPHHEITENPASHYSEKFRFIRNGLSLTLGNSDGLALSLRDRQDLVVLVTSSLPSEGKSTLIVSLALSLAAAGRRTLLVDADLRKPAIGKLLAADVTRPGLVAFLKKQASFEEVVQRHAASGLDYVPVEFSVAASQDLLNSGLTSEFFDHAREQYDFILLDSPPVVAVSDALWLTRFADATLFVVHWRQTPRAAVRAAVKKIRATGALLAGVVLTRVNVKKAGSLSPGDFDYYMDKTKSYYG
jgi:succinoglycan biosynthesis transport protein ExoP